MKTVLLAGMLGAAACPSLAFAGFGAIAYNPVTGASAESHGYAFYEEAANEALALCGFGCTVINWEENSCIALAAGGGRYGEGHGFATADLAADAAMAACGYGCAWQEWACN